MPPGRHAKPLFEYMAGTASRSGAAKPVVRVELKPAPRVEPAPLTPASEIAEELDAETLAPPSASVRVPLNYFYLGIAGLIVLAILAWVGGVKYGSSTEAARAERELAGAFRGVPSVREPVEPAGGPPTPAPGPRVMPPPAPSPSPSPVAQPASPPATPANGTGLTVLTSRGLGPDPRERGLNYLALATLPKTDAEAAIAFLASRGLECIGQAVDRRGGGANNQGPWYKLVALPGITSEQYGNKATARTNLEAAVARLGYEWQSKHRGASDFSMPGWEKLQ
jgi:hypothetical protein